jgi:hypothetical protein
MRRAARILAAGEAVGEQRRGARLARRPVEQGRQPMPPALANSKRSLGIFSPFYPPSRAGRQLWIGALSVRPGEERITNTVGSRSGGVNHVPIATVFNLLVPWATNRLAG